MAEFEIQKSLVLDREKAHITFQYGAGTLIVSVSDSKILPVQCRT